MRLKDVWQDIPSADQFEELVNSTPQAMWESHGKGAGELKVTVCTQALIDPDGVDGMRNGP